ncbi:MAG: DNA gyrase subunit A, partial [bacterium]
ILFKHDKSTFDNIDMLFNKDRPGDRRDWLNKVFKPGLEPEYQRNETDTSQFKYISYTDFINHEFINFSQYDNIRSIPSLADGLKPSQRQIAYTFMVHGINKDMKVAQAAAKIAEFVHYKHGETSLCDAIQRMCQDFTGTNNLPLLVPSGSFGSRLKFKSWSAPRYTFTRYQPYFKYIFKDEDVDLLEYNYDDNQKTEPKYLLPTIPLMLVNGARGMGTGWGTFIPNYKLGSIIRNIKRYLNGSPFKFMKPYYNDYIGDTEIIKKNGIPYRVIFTGIHSYDESTHKVTISEIPPVVSVDEIKNNIMKYEDYIDISKIYESINGNRVTISFKIVDPQGLKKKYGTNIESFINTKIRLRISKELNNHTVLNPETIKPETYQRVEHLLADFVNFRLPYYEKRRLNIIKKLTVLLNRLNSKYKYIKAVRDNIISLSKKNEESLLMAIKDQNINPDENGKYDFLLNIRSCDFTKDKLKKIKEDIEKNTNLRTEYENATDKDLWKKDLNELYKKVKETSTKPEPQS